MVVSAFLFKKWWPVFLSNYFLVSLVSSYRMCYTSECDDDETNNIKRRWTTEALSAKVYKAINSVTHAKIDSRVVVAPSCLEISANMITTCYCGCTKRL